MTPGLPHVAFWKPSKTQYVLCKIFLMTLELLWCCNVLYYWMWEKELYSEELCWASDSGSELERGGNSPIQWFSVKGNRDTEGRTKHSTLNPDFGRVREVCQVSRKRWLQSHLCYGGFLERSRLFSEGTANLHNWGSVMSLTWQSNRGDTCSVHRMEGQPDLITGLPVEPEKWLGLVPCSCELRTTWASLLQLGTTL